MTLLSKFQPAMVGRVASIGLATVALGAVAIRSVEPAPAKAQGVPPPAAVGKLYEETCTACHGTDLDWQPSSGRGTVYSFTAVHRAPLESFKVDVPYVIAIVALEEGVRAMVNLRGVDPETVAIGMPIEVFFEPTEGEYPLPQARPR